MERPGKENAEGCMGQRPMSRMERSLWSAGGRTAISSASSWAPEDGDQLADLRGFTRDAMRQMEEDLGTRLDWVAVDHFNTGHPHSHVVIRGKDETGKDLIIAQDYITDGVRLRAKSGQPWNWGRSPTSNCARNSRLR